MALWFLGPNVKSWEMRKKARVGVVFGVTNEYSKKHGEDEDEDEDGNKDKDEDGNKDKGRTLTPELLLTAYAQGFFPMPDGETAEILWFHPDPRAIIPLEKFHRSRSLRRTLRRVPFQVTFNQAFPKVLRACSHRQETWINEEITSAYTRLHHLGAAHSIEVWLEEKLVGGVYGVSLGGAFFAESKFHTVTDASKVALHHLVERMQQRRMSLLEVQFLTPHLATLGAIEISRESYLRLLDKALHHDTSIA